MLIYQFITLETRHQYRALMKEYFDQMSHIYGEATLDDYDTQAANYIVCKHPKYGVVGGIRLLPTQGPKLSDASLVNSGIVLHDEDTWEATKLFFYIPELIGTQELEQVHDQICLEFYTGLWRYIQEVCEIDTLVTLLPEEEHEDASFFGSWPFVLESPVNNPFDKDADEYLLGVLKLAQEAEFALAS